MKMVNVGPNPNFKPAKGEEGVWAKIKEERPKRLSYVTAMDNIRNSGGMYAILPEAAPAASVSAIQMPEEMSDAALKLTALQLGIDLSKKNLKRSELVKAVHLAMDAVQFAAEDEDDAEA